MAPRAELQILLRRSLITYISSRQKMWLWNIRASSMCEISADTKFADNEPYSHNVIYGNGH
jgi:hypothetical protein